MPFDQPPQSLKIRIVPEGVAIDISPLRQRRPPSPIGAVGILVSLPIGFILVKLSESSEAFAMVLAGMLIAFVVLVVILAATLPPPRELMVGPQDLCLIVREAGQVVCQERVLLRDIIDAKVEGVAPYPLLVAQIVGRNPLQIPIQRPREDVQWLAIEIVSASRVARSLGRLPKASPTSADAI